MNMAQVTSRVTYPEALERKVVEQQYYDLEARKQLEKKLTHLDDKVKDTVIQLETARQELYKVRSLNKGLLKKIDEEEADVKNLHTKLGSMKVKLGVANANLDTGNDEKEKLRTSLNEVQIEVARLEERLVASTSDLDRMRDPANPESNMSIRKHVVNDKKEIKSLKNEIEDEKNLLTIDKETVNTKDAKIKSLEKELAKVKAMLKECENERTEAQNEEEFERKRKEDFISEYQTLKIDRKNYDQRLKELKVKLGISIANQNVNSKFEVKLKRDEKSYTKQLAQVEKKLKDATGQLDVLKNQHRMSKTALSINQYTQRNQHKKGTDRPTSLAQSGTGPIKFGPSVQKEVTKAGTSSSTKGSMPSIPEKLLVSDGVQNKLSGQNSRKQRQPEKSNQQQNQTTSKSIGSGTTGPISRLPASIGSSQQGSTTSRTTTSSDKKGTNQLVPSTKPKLQNASIR